MKEINFNPNADYIYLKLTCPYCGEEIETESYPVPCPNYLADTSEDSENCDEFDYCCDCGETFRIEIYNGMCQGTVMIESSKDIENVEVYEDYETGSSYDEDFIESQTYQLVLQDTMDALSAIDGLTDGVKKTLYRTLYANLISSMESYLAGVLRQNVMGSEVYKRKFVETFKGYDSLSFNFHNIYTKMENIDNIIKKSLSELIYHKLPTVNGIYKNTLGVEFEKEQLADLMKAVDIRHHIVHRHGYDKEGNEIVISQEDVMELAEKVNDFITNIETVLLEKQIENF